MRKSFGILLACLAMGYALFLVATWKLSDGFRVKKIRSELTFCPEWEVSTPPSDTVNELLSQNFYYIGKGSQCYVFESEDQDIVIKFFRHPRYRLPRLAKYISAPTFLVDLQQQKISAKQQKLGMLFTSCKLAYEELYEESGLLYLHLNKTEGVLKNITVHDTLKRPYIIALDQHEFMIQKRGVHIFPYLAHLIQQGKKEQAKQALAKLASLIACRLKKGIVDRDAVIHKNSGFRSGEPLFLDVGGFFKTKPVSDPSPELWKTTGRLRDWLQKQDPEIADYFTRLLKAYNLNRSNSFATNDRFSSNA